MQSILNAILAQAADAAKPQQQPWMIWIFPIFMIFLLLMWFQARSQQKKQKSEREDLLKELKPKDKIETVGGILGTVVSVRDEEVSIRVDDARDVTIRIAKTAIRKRIGDKKEADTPKS
jgi:preprotein translocase subunit YajC